MTPPDLFDVHSAPLCPVSVEVLEAEFTSASCEEDLNRALVRKNVSMAAGRVTNDQAKALRELYLERRVELRRAAKGASAP